MSEDITSKTTIYLNTADYRRLKALARSEGRTTAELVREAVAQYVVRRSAVARPSSVASARSGRSDLSERAEDLLSGMGRDE
jgi:predicted transcriptional regulator